MMKIIQRKTVQGLSNNFDDDYMEIPVENIVIMSEETAVEPEEMVLETEETTVERATNIEDVGISESISSEIEQVQKFQLKVTIGKHIHQKICKQRKTKNFV